MIRFGILGAGVVADYHREAIAANCDAGAELTAVSTQRQARFDEVAAAFGVRCVDERELLERSDVDVVCICTPSGLHAQQALAAIEAGKHVLVEKPLALSVSDVDAVAEAAVRHGVRVGVVLQRRASPTFQRVAERLHAGAFGTPALATLTIPYYRPASYYQQAAWRGAWALDGGGVLMNQGIHLVDLLVWFLGDPVEMQAEADTLAHEIEVEDTVVATLRFASGLLATVSATTTAIPGVPHRIEVYGTKGFVRIEGETVSACHPEGALESVSLHSADAGAAASPRGIDSDGHRRIVRDMIDAVREGRPPLVGPNEARRSLAVVLSIYEAARRANSVE